MTSLTYKRAGSVLGDLTYEYDANGKRTRMGGSFARSLTPPTLASASYNAANQQLAFGSKTLTYDLNGNLLGDGTNTYTWDARNRLVSMTGAGVNASFQYDAAGGRSSKTINGATTSFLYDGANVVQEQSAQLGNANIVNGGIDEVFTRSDSSGTFSPMADGLGSSLSLTAVSGTIQTDYTYGAFGQSATTGATSNNSSQYTGRENDNTGLQYNRARYYSPALQRFISEDPIGFAGGINSYAYVGNDPLNFVDPSGLDKKCQVCGGGWQGIMYGGQPAWISPTSGMIRDIHGTQIGWGGEPGLQEPSINPVMVGASLLAGGMAAAARPPRPFPPNSSIIVRGGQGTLPSPGTTFSGAYGSTLGEAAAAVPHGTIRSTTAGALRSNGGSVVHAPELTRSGVLNNRHVNITEGSGASTFSGPFPNPVPRSGRIQ